MGWPMFKLSFKILQKNGHNFYKFGFSAYRSLEGSLILDIGANKVIITERERLALLVCIKETHLMCYCRCIS